MIQEQLQQHKNRFNIQIRTAKKSLQNYQQVKIHLQKQISIALSVVRAAEARYRVGEGTIIQLTDAYRALLTSQQQSVILRAHYRDTLINLAEAIGNPLFGI